MAVPMANDPPFAMLNHSESDSGIPNESADVRFGISGRIVRGLAERIDAVVWFSDLRGFTRITDTTPEQMIPLLNDYSDVIVSAIHEHGGDVLKLIGDGTLAIFTAESRTHACNAALAAAIAAPRVLPN